MNSIILHNKIENLLASFESYFFENFFKTNKFSENLNEKLKEILKIFCEDDSLVEKIIFELPNIKKQIEEDLGFFMISDPAIKCIEEVVICYLSFKAVWIYRITHLLDNLKIPILPRYLSEYVHMISSIDIHPSAKISSPFFIDHGTGVVIGETAEIGHHVKIYQGVTLGAKNLNNVKNKKRHPTIGNYVTIYADAKILGGKTFVKDYTIVKCNELIVN